MSKVDSLLDCLLILGAIHGQVTTRESLTAGLPLKNARLEPELFSRAANRIGLTTKIHKKTLSHINPSLLPAVLLLRDNQACLLLRFSEQKGATVIFPELGDAAVDISAEELEDQYLGRVIFARPRFRFDQRSPELKNNHTQQHWFWSSFRASFSLYRDVLIAAFFINLMAIALPLFTMNVYDRVIPNSAVETLWVLAIGVAIVVIADAILRTIRGYYLDLASKRIDIRLSAEIMERVLGLRMESRPVSAGSFAANLRSFETIRDFITSATITAVIDLPFTLIFLILIFWIAGPMALPALIGMTVIVLFALTTQAKMEELTETTYRASALRNATLIESLVGLDTVKAMAAEGIMQRRWEQSATFLARVSIRLRLLASSNVNLVMWVQQWVTIGVIISGVYLITAGELSMGGLIASTMLSARAMAPFGGIAGLLTQYHHARTAFSSLNEIMETPVERNPDARLVHRQKLKGKIEFRNVSFTYPGSEVPALKNVSFSIEPGEHVAFIGRVGSGKSSLQRLAIGLFQPTEGAVLVDGIDVRQLDLAELRQQVGYVAQDVTLFYGSLRENIVLAHPQAEDEDVIRAAEFANLGDFVNTHPNGFDMVIGERGDSISGGQRKSIALARAVVHDPQVLLLDEPTGSMDHSTETWINNKIQEFSEGKTVLVATHRTSVLGWVDRIIVIDNGQVVADGPRDSVASALREGRIGKAS
ncbi:type I secretion system permease/ATPase [Teredinibacter haidensis]|uniref:type I secretion system permease/ATPase n=1 Tax=Teredinibacter haidensis TaxID=2731755 RepID=UPI000A437D36|nr:type I secretion system permease/ATPase [Teredinibacter haidensis]